MMKRFISGQRFILLLICGLATTAQAAPQVFFPTDNLPPPNAVYISPAQWHALYANGVIISNVSHSRFLSTYPPPAIGASVTHSFGSTLSFDVSFNNGASFTHATAPASVTVNVQGITQGTQRFFDTEMLQLVVSGGSLPPGVMIRESPTLASTGQTAIGQVPGGFQISSSFDIFTEVSLDGGQTWSPATQAGHMDLRADPTVGPPVVEPTPLVPPPAGTYITPALYHLAYAAGIIIKDVRHKYFTQSLNPLTIGTNKVTEQFGSAVDFMLSMNGGQTFTPVRAQGNVSVSLAAARPGPNALFDTEMLQLDVFGGDLPPNVRLRESPTLASYGETEVDQISGDTYRIHSFFDVFTELSTDGGQTWQQSSNGPAHVELQRPAPIYLYPQPNLPPTNGQYILPPGSAVHYANGVIISNVNKRALVPSLLPPPPGQGQLQDFFGPVDLTVSLGPGQPFLPASGTVQGTLVISNRSAAGSSASYYDTEMLQMNISGPGFPGGLMIRESPSKASLGRTTESLDPSTGQFRISSFFDVFTEVSLDNGQSWSPINDVVASTILRPVNPILDFRIFCPSDITVTATGLGGAVVNYLVTTIIGDCPLLPTGTVTCNPPSGSVFPLGTTKVTCTGHNGCGEHPTCSFNVTVLPNFSQFAGFAHVALGAATLSITGAPSPSLVVGNLGPGGQDGFHLELGAVDSAVYYFSPFPTIVNTCIVSIATGPYALVPTQTLSSFTYLGGSNPVVRADYSFIGATSLVARVTDENNHLVSLTTIPNNSWLDINSLFPPPCDHANKTVYTYWQGPDFSWIRFCAYGCNCIGTNCWTERVACLIPITQIRPRWLSAMDMRSQGVAVPSSLVISNEALGMFGVLHEARGQAALEGHQGLLLINNIGSSGQDGVAIDVNDVGQLDIALAPTRNQIPGSTIKFTAYGRFNNSPGMNLGSAQVKHSVGPGGGCDVSADFSSIGATQLRVSVYQGSQLVGGTTLSNGPLGTIFGSGNIIGCGKFPPPLPCYWLALDSPFTFIASDSHMFVGDHLRIVAANPAGEVQSLSQFVIQGAGLSQLAIIGETVPPVLTGITPVAGGGFKIEGRGIIGANYRLEGRGNLNPGVTWTPVSSANADLYGAFQILDLSSGLTQRFYRVVTP